ncbi:MAG: CoA transferase, partial [Alphaproteobacteria bacterium]
MNAATTPHDALRRIWADAACDPGAPERIALDGDDPVLPSTFRVGSAALASIGAATLAATEIWQARTGRAQPAALDVRAAAAAFRSERYIWVDGAAPPDPWSPIAGFYRAGDGRWIQLHTNFPHHRDGVLRLLGCADDRTAVARAIEGWEAATLEDALAEAQMCAAMVRSPEEWRTHPQGRAVAAEPLFAIERIGDAPPEPLPADGGRPLDGVRALDLTRVIAGPVCGRTLAEHGAAVMRVAGPHLPFVPTLVMDTGRGKFSAHVDLRGEAGRATLAALARDADIFVQAYRPGAIAARGFGPEQVAALRPGIVYVSLCAYGYAGPWRDRRGFDSLLQSASGIAWEEGRAAGTDGPKHLPCQALDHATGYLAAFGAMVGLLRRMREGGSWHVRVSLARTGRWIEDLGRIDGMSHPDLKRETIGDLLQVTDTPFGRISHVAPAARLPETPCYWALPSVP